MGNQKYHFVCLACRRCVKRKPQWRSVLEEGRETVAATPVTCAQCEATMFGAGKYFAAPKRRDDAGWKKLIWMIENGWRGDGWRGNHWPTSPAMNLNQIRESLRHNREARTANLKRDKTAASFDETKIRARCNARNSRVARKRAALELRAQRKYQDAVLARVAESE